MACWLAFVDEGRECEGCGATLPPGLIGLTDEVTGRLVAQCKVCLFSLDRRLAAAWITSIAAMAPEEFDEMVGRLLERPEFADLVEDLELT